AFTRSALPMNRRLLRTLIVIVLVVFALALSSSWFMNLLWMRYVGYEGIFWTLTTARWSLAAISFAVAAVFLVLNLRFLADRMQWITLAGTPLQQLQFDLSEHHKTIRQLLTGIGLLLALFFSMNFYV